MKQCNAKSKRSGECCKNFAMKDKNVCRFHGGKSKGPKTPEGKARIIEANTKHGHYSKEVIAAKQNAKALIQSARETINHC